MINNFNIRNPGLVKITLGRSYLTGCQVQALTFAWYLPKTAVYMPNTCVTEIPINAAVLVGAVSDPGFIFLKENVFFPAAAALSHPWAASICRPPAPASFDCLALQPVPSTLGCEKREHFVATPVFLFTKIKTSLLLGISLPFCLTCSSASICLILIFITLDILKLLDTWMILLSFQKVFFLTRQQINWVRHLPSSITCCFCNANTTRQLLRANAALILLNRSLILHISHQNS